MPTTTLTKVAAGLTLLAASLTACTGSSGSPSDDQQASAPSARPSSAGPAEPVLLRIGTDDIADTPAGEQIEHFAEEVSRLSAGSITVRPVWHAAGDTSRWDQAVAKLTMDGDLDMAVVPSRAWDALGVKSLTALSAPFLITSDELTAEVVTAALEDDLLAGLPEAGVIGIGLLPEGLRHPFGYDEPLLGPEDYAGQLLRTPHSTTVNATIQSLGADATDAEADYATQAGAESSYRLSPAGIATGNVVFFPKVNSLVINADAHESLSDEQQATLEDAAERTQDWVIRTFPTDNEAARVYCEEGGRIVAAPAPDIAALVQATMPVLEDLRSDSDTAAILDQITAMKENAQNPPEPVTSCGDTQTGQQARHVDGVYTFTPTAKAFRDAGVTDEGLIHDNAGPMTVTLDGGTWTMEQILSAGPQKGETWTGTGSYTIKDNRMTWYWAHEPGAWSRAHFVIQPDGTLQFSKQVAGEGPEVSRLDSVFFDVWERAGELP